MVFWGEFKYGLKVIEIFWKLRPLTKSHLPEGSKLLQVEVIFTF